MLWRFKLMEELQQLQQQNHELAGLVLNLCRLLNHHQGGEPLSYLEPQDRNLLAGVGVLKDETPKFAITYFKSTGKYYGSALVELEVRRCKVGETPTEADSIYMAGACEKVRQMNANAQLPGLQSGRWEGFILVDHPHGYPCLLNP
jgi:hypothetical protein